MVLIAAATFGVGAVAARLVDVGWLLAPPADRSAAVNVHAGARGTRVPPSFLGLSVEWDSVAAYTGPPDQRRQALLRLLAPVGRAQRSPLALRIGGDSGDQAWWNPQGRKRPPTVLQDLGPGTLNDISWLAAGLGGPVTLGLNLALGDPANARAVAAAGRRLLPQGQPAALELGNEPDLYRSGKTFRSGGHLHRRLAKDPHYTMASYAAAIDRYLRALAQPGGPRLAVGGFAGTGWWSALPRVLGRPGGGAGEIVAHLYAVGRCGGPTPSAEWLMSRAASDARVATLRPALAMARRHRLPLRVDELGSAPCGGRRGFSDSAAAVLWLTDTLFALLQAGAAGVDAHTWEGAVYAPFAARGDGAVARPPLSGLLAFARAAPTGSRLVPVSVHDGHGLRAWATVDRHSVVRVALLAPRPTTVIVGAGGRACAGLWRAPRASRAPACGDRQGRGYRQRLPGRSVTVVTLRPRGGHRRTGGRA
jgi:hypothetical protein